MKLGNDNGQTGRYFRGNAADELPWRKNDWLAVVHHTRRTGTTGHFHRFDNGDPGRSKRYQEFENALKNQDLVVQRVGNPDTLARDGYAGVFRFSDLKIDYATGISFTFTERYADPQ